MNDDWTMNEERKSAFNMCRYLAAYLLTGRPQYFSHADDLAQHILRSIDEWIEFQERKTERGS